jgi:histidinol-phosphatase (PHP family)
MLSDGHCTASECVRAAIAAGLDELGFSDHYVLAPPGWKVDWSMPVDSLPGYFRALHAAKQEAGDRLIVRYGLEADFFPDTAAELAEILQAYPFDYVIGSVHFVDGFPIDDSAGMWDSLSEDERNDMVRAYWSRVTAMAESGLFDIAAHLDLYKKFGHRPTVDVSADIAIALDAIARSGMAVELNTAGLDKAAKEIYPSLAILRECRRRSIPSLVTADAHDISRLTRSRDLGVETLREAGYTEQAIFAGRKMTLVPL